MMRATSITVLIFLFFFGMESIARVPIPLKTVGTAKLRMFFFNIYKSEIKTESGSYENGIRPIQLSISYNRKITSQALIRQTNREWDTQGIQKKQRQAWIVRLEEIWPSVKPGDTLVFELTFEHSRFSLSQGQLQSHQI